MGCTLQFICFISLKYFPIITDMILEITPVNRAVVAAFSSPISIFKFIFSYFAFSFLYYFTAIFLNIVQLVVTIFKVFVILLNFYDSFIKITIYKFVLNKNRVNL